MKLLIVLILSFLIIKTNIPSTDRCDLETAKNALPVRIFAETTIDPHNQPVLITRFSHNKVTILANELGRCYFNFFDLNFVANSTALIGLLPWLYFVYKSFSHPILQVPIMLIPLLPILSQTQVPVAYAHKIFAIIGLVYFAKRSNE